MVELLFSFFLFLFVIWLVFMQSFFASFHNGYYCNDLLASSSQVSFVVLSPPLYFTKE